MIYEGKAITVKALEGGIVELNFDLKGESVNKFNRLTLTELRQSVDAIKADGSIKGVIVTSGKDVFIVGADITEFVDNFKLPDEELVAGNLEANKIFSDFEDLAVPTVVAINGIALGGGFEMCLSADYRVMSAKAVVGTRRSSNAKPLRRACSRAFRLRQWRWPMGSMPTCCAAGSRTIATRRKSKLAPRSVFKRKSLVPRPWYRLPCPLPRSNLRVKSRLPSIAIRRWSK